MKAIHNQLSYGNWADGVVSYLKDTQKWKQFTTRSIICFPFTVLCHISKILKNESNSQLSWWLSLRRMSCVISQRYSKMKAIHNHKPILPLCFPVVSYLKDTQKWKQFTTTDIYFNGEALLCHISKILKNESNSQLWPHLRQAMIRCVISQRYSKMKAIHNNQEMVVLSKSVVSYLKDTQKWKQFTTFWFCCRTCQPLCHISKILKNESNSQQFRMLHFYKIRCVISQRYSKMKAIHNPIRVTEYFHLVVSYLKDTQKWKQFTTTINVVYIDNKLCHISKILKNESNSQHSKKRLKSSASCVISQRYSKMKAIHNR